MSSTTKSSDTSAADAAKRKMASELSNIADRTKEKYREVESLINNTPGLFTKFSSELQDKVPSDAFFLQSNREITREVYEKDKSYNESKLRETQGYLEKLKEFHKEIMEYRSNDQKNKQKRDAFEDEKEKLKNAIGGVFEVYDVINKEYSTNIETEEQNALDEIRNKIKSIERQLNNLDFENGGLEVLPSIYDQIKETQTELSNLNRTLKKKESVNEIISGNSGDQIQGEGSDEANDFLEDVDLAVAELKKTLKSIDSTMISTVTKGFDSSVLDANITKTSKVEKEVKALEIDVENAKSDIDSKRGSGLKTFNEERVLNDFNRRLLEKQRELEKLKSSSSSFFKLNIDNFAPFFDKNLASVRRYQQQLREAFEKNDVATIDDNGTKEALRKKLGVLFNEVLSYIDALRFGKSLGQKKFEAAKLPRSQIDVFSLIESLYDDNVSDVNISLNVVHKEILNKIKIDKAGWTKNRPAILLLYVFKSLRVAASWLAFYLADKLFTEYYNKNKNSVTDPRTVDLRWYVAIYASFQFAFDVIALVVMYFVRRIDPDVITGALMLDYVFDSTVVTLMVLASSVWIADIVQSKKLFAYRTNGKRAVRALRTIMVWLLILHSSAPYFYIAGPNFTGQAKFKKIDEKVRKEKAKKAAAKKTEPA